MLWHAVTMWHHFGPMFFSSWTACKCRRIQYTQTSQHATSYDRKGHLNFRTRWSNSGEEKASEFWSDWCVFYSWSPSFWGVVKKSTIMGVFTKTGPPGFEPDLLYNAAACRAPYGDIVLQETASLWLHLLEKTFIHSPSFCCRMFGTLFVPWSTDTALPHLSMWPNDQKQHLLIKSRP